MIHSIILARGGSKGIKNKNLKLIKNKPLIYWSIKASLKSKKINKTWVSSDSDKIIKFSKKCGASTIKRPKLLSNDYASSESAWLHAVKSIEKNYKIKTVVGIQPTSPIKTHKDYDQALKLYIEKKYDSLFSSMIIKDYCVWEYKNKLVSLYNHFNRKRRQDIKKKYLENGSFYIFDKKKFLKSKNRLFGKIGTFTQSKTKSIQIDSLEDIFIVNALLNNKKIKSYNK